VARLVRRGDRFRTTREVEVGVIYLMFAPSHTVGGEAVLPAGTIIIASDQVPWAEGFGAYPEDYDELEDVLVPEALRSKEMYE
jgi:hypothetical protein